MSELENFYFNNLKELRNIKKELQSTGTVSPVERDNLYYLNFMGLLRSGVHYERKDNTFVDDFTIVDNEDDKTEESNKKNSKLVFPGMKPKEEPLTGILADDPTRVMEKRGDLIRIKHENDYFDCPENELINYFGDLYNDLVSSKNKSGSISDGDMEAGIPMMDIFANDDADILSKQVNKGSKKEEEKNDKPVVKVDIIESFKQFPDDPAGRKSYDTFLYNQHFIEVIMKNRQSRKFIATIYPLYMDLSDSITSDIVVIMVDDQNRTRCKCSSSIPGESKQIEIDYADCKFIIRGKIQSGDFISDVTLVDDVTEDFHPKKNEQIKKIRPTSKTSSFYLRHKGSDGTVIDLFPIRLRQNDNETGIAPSAMIHETGEPRTVLMPTGKNSYELIFEGEKKSIIPFWEGNDLVCKITSSDD